MNQVNKIFRISMISLSLALVFTNGMAQEYNSEGQAVGWTAARYDNSWAAQVGGRFLPEINFRVPAGSKLWFEGEFSANAAGSWTNMSENEKFYLKIKPYRAWLKIGSDQFELRAGLQKINFGAATMLRSLMWFDRIDPRDPLQLTDGVQGLLGRYYFLNNANIWLWGLYGNSGTRGWEYLKSNQHRPEFGGRLQLPAPRSEIAFTYNNREVEDSLVIAGSSTGSFHFNEQKFAVDIKADLEIGIWAEGVLKYSNTDIIPGYEKMITLGADYTFGIGNGLLLTFEYLGLSASDNLFSDTRSVTGFAGLSANYPISLVAGISAIVYYNPGSGDLYRFVNMALDYDRFSFYFIGFWNPSNYQLLNMKNETTMFSGSGLQVMAVFNY